ncbi:hypothetical protein SO802_011732 [Lithocarpus litseifolius]|uniref:Uncharacterized protein n=1 Tax=Lithocarpus litseifolius TaxID=425828 RepID=A0AAW2D4P1_9ROSI
MGKRSAKRLLFNVEELIFGQSSGQFAKSCCEGDKFFILQLGSNSHGAFLLISELTYGRRKGSIVVPEVKSGSGWRGFGLHLRKINNGSGGDIGKKKNALIQNTNFEQPGVKSLSVFSHNNSVEGILGQRKPPGVKILSESSHVNRVTCKDSTRGQRDQIGAKILSTIDGIEDKDHNHSLANPDHRQRGNSDLVALGVSASRVLPPGQADASSSDDGLMPMRVLDTPVIGKESAARCSFVLGIPDSGKAVFSRFLGFGALETQGLGRWDIGFNGDLVISSVVAGI